MGSISSREGQRSPEELLDDPVRWTIIEWGATWIRTKQSDDVGRVSLSAESDRMRGDCMGTIGYSGCSKKLLTQED